MLDYGHTVMSAVISVEEWRRQAYTRGRTQAQRELSAIDTLSDMLERRSTPATAARTITALYEPYINKDKENYVVYSRWAKFCSAIRSFGYDGEYTERLVDMLKSISDFRILDDEGQLLIVAGFEYWKSLPWFDMIYRERCAGKLIPLIVNILILVTHLSRTLDLSFDELEEDQRRTEVAALLNSAHFAATYCKKYGTHIDFLTIGTIGNGVEDDMKTQEELEEASIYVPPAATWILIAGHRIFDYCQQNFEREPFQGPSFGGENLWKDDKGYSLERWAFWKQRFGEIAHMQNLDACAQDFALRAFDEMTSIENSQLR